MFIILSSIDATDVPDYGKVVVGYIGRHLTNGQTN